MGKRSIPSRSSRSSSSYSSSLPTSSTETTGLATGTGTVCGAGGDSETVASMGASWTGMIVVVLALVAGSAPSAALGFSIGLSSECRVSMSFPLLLMGYVVVCRDNTDALTQSCRASRKSGVVL
jgi:hypothetical protein